MELSENIITARSLYNKLNQELRILHLVYHRNKNQHRATTWWKSFNILKRNCCKSVDILQNVCFTNINKKTILRVDRDLIHLFNMINPMIKHKSRRIYYDFNGVIALGQFVTLGVVLVGIQARIYAIYKSLFELFISDFKRLQCINNKILDSLQNDTVMEEKFAQSLESANIEELGEIFNEELGETIESSDLFLLEKPVIDIKISSSDTGDNQNKKKEKKKKKKSKKTAIDDLFG